MDKFEDYLEERLTDLECCSPEVQWLEERYDLETAILKRTLKAYRAIKKENEKTVSTFERYLQNKYDLLKSYKRSGSNISITDVYLALVSEVEDIMCNYYKCKAADRVIQEDYTILKALKESGD